MSKWRNTFVTYMKQLLCGNAFCTLFCFSFMCSYEYLQMRMFCHISASVLGYIWRRKSNKYKTIQKEQGIFCSFHTETKYRKTQTEDIWMWIQGFAVISLGEYVWGLQSSLLDIHSLLISPHAPIQDVSSYTYHRNQTRNWPTTLSLPLTTTFNLSYSANTTKQCHREYLGNLLFVLWKSCAAL